ncbi:MAG TPA: hypothetical protein VFP64_17200 [Pyrinomonadaceae bacterium]|nr:hypothetical protein [Pyrinomonadaceae bacterium]
MKHKTNLLMLTLTFLFGSIIAFGQAAAPNLSGTYEAMVMIPNHGEQKVTLELKNDGGKITARITHGPKTADSTEAKLDNGTLTLNFGEGRIITAKVDGDKIVGEATDGPAKIPVEFKKVTPAAAASPATAAAPAAPATAPAPAAPAAPFDLNGQWEAVADANGQPVPFTLTLKVEGETVTGSSSSQIGDSVVKSGTWKDGKLTLQLEGQNGVISCTAIVIDGKLSGEYDFAGQLSGRWVAVKKN